MSLSIPISEEAIRALHVGDAVRLSGLMVTARDAAHKYMAETFIRTSAIPESELLLHEKLRQTLREGIIYHCGPVVRYSPRASREDTPGRDYEFIAAGPTTSLRQEAYEPDVIAHFELRGVVGKGDMGPATLHALQEHGAVYFHAVGGAASLIAHTVWEVVAVYKQKAFGTPEALWVIRVEGFPAVVTMDSHGRSIHDEMEAVSKEALERLIAG